MEEFLAEGKGVFWIMTEKEKGGGSTAGGKKEPILGEPRTNQVPLEAEEGMTELAPQPKEVLVEDKLRELIDNSSHDRVYNLSTLNQILSSWFPQESPDNEMVIEVLWKLREKGYVIYRHYYKIIPPVATIKSGKVDDRYNIPQAELVFNDLAEFRKEVLEGKQFRVLSPKASTLLEKVKERDEYLDVLLRTKADFSNYQKRMKRELESMGRYATQDLVKALIPAMDHLSRAIKSAGSSAAGERATNSESLRKFLDGLQLIQNEFLKALEGTGVKNVEGTVGQPFNPEFHEAFLEEEDAKLPHHTILEMLEPGFVLHDRVLKPAKVKVSKKPALHEGKPGQEAPPAKEESLPETKPDSPQAEKNDG